MWQPVHAAAFSLLDTRLWEYLTDGPWAGAAALELIAHAGTEEAVVEAVEALIPRTGKLTARINDKAGFVLNRLQYLLLKEAFNLVEEGAATPQDVDTIVRTTFGYRLPVPIEFGLINYRAAISQALDLGFRGASYASTTAAMPSR